MNKKTSQKNKKTVLSTYEETIQNPKRKTKIEEGYRKFLLSELLIALIEDDYEAAKKLAQAAGIKPSTSNKTVLQKKEHLILKSFSHIAASLGYGILLEKLPTNLRK